MHEESMLKITINDVQPTHHSSGLQAFVVCDDASFDKEVKSIEKSRCPGLSALVKNQEFSGSAGASLVVPTSDATQVSYTMLEGLGKKKKKIYRYKNIS